MSNDLISPVGTDAVIYTPPPFQQQPACAECRHCKHTLFESCTTNEFKNIRSAKSHRTYKKKQILYMEGERSEGIHCIYSGKIKVVKINREGKEQIVKIATPGMNLGHHAQASGSFYSNSAIALEDAVVCFVPKEVFLKICSENIKANAGLLKRLSLDFIEAEEAIKHMAFKPVRERMADALLLLKKAYSHQGDGEFRISISRADLASLIGTAKETTTRLLTELKKENIITMEGRGIRVIGWEKLEQMSHLYD